MRRRMSRFLRRNHAAIGEYIAIALFSAALTSIVLLSYVYFTAAVAGLTGIPEEVLQDAVESNVGGVLLFGDHETRHNFGKGVPTRYGAMSYDVEERLMGAPYYWTSEEVHAKGLLTGFSGPE